MFSLQSTQEQKFIEATLEKHLRLDGRDLHEYRPIRIKFSGCTDGIVQVSLGNTKVLAKSSKKMVNPRKGKASEGNYRFHVNFSHMQLNAD
jgi:exosome complex RNA-binding protein Rrp42 (RNase PH superfamily)